MWTTRARFCPLCAAPLEERDVGGRARPACTACAFVLYAGPAGAAAAVVLDADRRVLLVRRSIPPYEGAWALPAGYQELEESPAAAVEREVLEETGLEIRVVGLLDLQHVPDDPRKPANVAVHLAHPVDPDARARAGDDAAAVGWFPLDALPEDLGFPDNRRILEALAGGEGYPLPLPGSRPARPPEAAPPRPEP